MMKFILTLEQAGKLGNAFKWPRQKDDIWLPQRNVIYRLVDEPAPVGKTERTLRITEKELQNVLAAFEKSNQ